MWLQFDLKYIANESPNLSRLESWCTHIGLHMGEINILIFAHSELCHWAGSAEYEPVLQCAESAAEEQR